MKHPGLGVFFGPLLEQAVYYLRDSTLVCEVTAARHRADVPEVHELATRNRTGEGLLRSTAECGGAA